MKMKRYRPILRNLRITLVKLQRHRIALDDKILILFEGRNAAGKHAVIKRIVDLSRHERRQRMRIRMTAQEAIRRSLSLFNAPRGGKDVSQPRQLLLENLAGLSAQLASRAEISNLAQALGRNPRVRFPSPYAVSRA